MPLCPKSKITKSSRLKNLSGTSIKILGTIQARFPEIIRVIELDTKIRFSPNLAEKFLTAYVEERGYLYTGATLRNIPWMVAYFSDSQSLFGQSLFGNPTLTQAIQKHVPEARFDENGKLTTGPCYYEIDCCFVGHRQTVKDDGIEETLEFQVHRALHTFYHEVITIRPRLFETMTDTGFPPWKTRSLRDTAHRVLSKHLGPDITKLEPPQFDP